MKTLTGFDLFIYFCSMLHELYFYVYRIIILKGLSPNAPSSQFLVAIGDSKYDLKNRESSQYKLTPKVFVPKLSKLLQIALRRCKLSFSKLKPFKVFLIKRSCSKLVCPNVYQFFNTFTTWISKNNMLKVENQVF